MRKPVMWWKSVKAALRIAGVVGLVSLPWAGGGPLEGQTCESPLPYLFILLDTSGSMNWAPPCNATDLGNGDCSLLCTSGECRAPLNADDPASKLFLVKSALHESLAASEADGIRFGFATFNQDTLSVRSKHWLYEATENGVTIPSAGSFPATGDREVFGKTWSCDTGSGDHDIGCYNTSPADLPDAWEKERIRQLPKGGQTLSETVTFFVRQSSITYRVQYIPLSGSLGSSVDMRVKVEKCLNASCSSRSLTGQTDVTFSVVAEHLSWSVTTDRSQPLDYFAQSSGADVSASNTCAGWDPNTDSTSDEANSYSLRWATVADSYSRGSDFSSGDVLPFDWLDDHRQDILDRMAPNQIASPLDPPDFGTSVYLNDAPLTGQSYLRLKDEAARPLIAFGSTPIGNSLQSFQTWWGSWAATAASEDPDWSCRRHAVVLVTDGDETCAANPCEVADDLYSIDGVSTYVVAFGTSGTTYLECIAEDGGTAAPFLADNHGELVQALKDVFTAVKEP